MARAPKAPDTPMGRSGKYDRPNADTSGNYGGLDDRLVYGGGRDPGNLSETGRETTTHDYGGDDARNEDGYESGARRPEEARAEDDSDDRGDPRR